MMYTNYRTRRTFNNMMTTRMKHLLRNNAHLAMILLILITSNGVQAQTAVWRDWSSFSDCSVSCGGGVQERFRTCNVLEDGATCDGPDTDYQFCNFHECPRNGTWTQWSGWTICPVSCGGGTQRRSRTCEGVVGGGIPCVGDKEEIVTCNNALCPQNGAWSSWTSFSDCPVTCGGGTRLRSRSCDNPPPINGGRSCYGEATEWELCNQDSCNNNEVVDGNWGPWTLYTACSATCEEGVKSRSRSCSDPLPANGGATCTGGSGYEQTTCNDRQCPVAGNWAVWGEWSACSVTCNTGSRQRMRTCSDPEPLHNGALCNATLDNANLANVAEEVGMKQTETEDCDLGACTAINGSWSSWSNVYSCSVTCGTGVQLRTRECDDPLPQNGGDLCTPDNLLKANTTSDGILIELGTFACTASIVNCPIHGIWNAWSTWSTCNVTCGTGSQLRERTCTSPQFGGVTCEGSATETKDCVMPVCDIPGQWTLWTTWTDCSVSCGGGMRRHTRNCTNPPPSGNGAKCIGLGDEEQSCNSQSCPAVDGAWSTWTEWSKCSDPCNPEVGIRTRLRLCNDPAPDRGGTGCSGPDIKYKPCDDDLPCIVPTQDGAWSEWEPWSRCSVTCGDGAIQRTRRCNSPAPSPDGVPCLRQVNPGPLRYPEEYLSEEFEMETCHAKPCPVDGGWASWTAWDACDRPCGGGMRWRRKYCENPRPQNGGEPCPETSPYVNFASEAGGCNFQDCSAFENVTIPPPPSTTTKVKKFCDKQASHDGQTWPRIEVGQVEQLLCPAGSVGFVYRICLSENVWSRVDTTGCKTATFDDLNNIAIYMAKNRRNTSAIMETATRTKALCTAGTIKLSGELKDCHRVLLKLLQRGIPLDPGLSEPEMKSIYAMIIDILNEILSPSLKGLWDSIVDNERNDDTNTLNELPQAVLTMVRELCLYIQASDSRPFCLVRVNIEACCDVVECDVKVSYRYPPKGPDPTPPNKHIRGGWTPPPEPQISYLTISGDIIFDARCVDTRKKRQVSLDIDSLLAEVGAGAETNGNRTLYKKYPGSVVYHSLDDLLPDINKIPYTAPDPPGTVIVTVEDTHIVNADVMSFNLVGKTDKVNESLTTTIRFYHNKEGRDQFCASLDQRKRNMEYDETSCNISLVTVNYTECVCFVEDGTFVLLMKPGIIRDNITYVVTPDVFFEYGCYIGVAVHSICILALIFIGLWDIDRHFIVINFCLSTVIYQLFTPLGRRWVNDDGLCYFMSWLVHFATLVNICWVMALSAYCFKMAKNTKPLRFRHRVYYMAICWLIPCFIATVAAALRHGYVIRTYFCWLSPDEYTNLSFFIPICVIAVVAVVVLIVAYTMDKPQSKMDLEELLQGTELGTRQRYKRALFIFILIVLVTLVFYGLNIGVAFLLGNLAQCMFVALIFVVLNADVQEGYSSKKNSVEEFIRLKKEQEGPELQMTQRQQLGDPEWVRQTRTAPMITIDVTHGGGQYNTEDDMTYEERRAFRREKRRQKRLAAEKPVYIARTAQTQPLPPQQPSRAAAYRSAPTPKLRPPTAANAIELSTPIQPTTLATPSARRSVSRSRSRRMTKNMSSS